MYESRRHSPLPRRAFLRRLALHFGIVCALAAGSLLIGMAGYEHYEGLQWRDAFLNSAMLLGGMGPVDEPQTAGGKLFAGFYALYAGLIFVVATAVLGAPIFHRLLHKFHWDEQ
jgi:hypothetical protein